MRRAASLPSEIGKKSHGLFESVEEEQFDAGSFHTDAELRPIVGRRLWLLDLTFQRMKQGLTVQPYIRRIIMRGTFELGGIEGIGGSGGAI